MKGLSHLFYDVVIVGGSLAGSLIAYRLRQKRPELNLLIIEKSHQLGGERTAHFYGPDLNSSQLEWLKPFIAKSWPGYLVRFPQYSRTLSTSYSAATPESLNKVLKSALENCLWRDDEVVEVSAHQVRLRNGDVLRSHCVIDARDKRIPDVTPLGYQKFVALDLELASPHRLSHLVLIDALCAQSDGYRYFSVLPWNDQTLHIEDNYYSDTPFLAIPRIVDQIHRYADQNFSKVVAVRRQETGVVPILLSSSSKVDRELGVVIKGHTSLSSIAKLADLIAEEEEITTQKISSLVANFYRTTPVRRRFYTLTHQMLFRSAPPKERYQLPQYFYRLPQSTIENFYSGCLSRMDCLKVLSGKPPIPIRRALECIFSQVAQSRRMQAE